MARTPYPHAAFGQTVGEEVITGNVYWVDSNDDQASDGNAGDDPERPMASLDGAVGRCTANNGDHIFLKPGHNETISAASGADIDVAGVTVVGLGVGADQPSFNFTAAGSTIDIGAANVVVKNLHFISDVTSVALAIDVQDGSDDLKILDCRFTCNTLGTDEFTDGVIITTSDRVEIGDCYFDMDEAAAASAIQFAGICLGANIHDNTVLGDYSVACIEGITTASEQIIIQNNTLVNGVHGGLNTLGCITLLTGTTGFIQGNHLYTNVTNAVTAAISADGCFLANNTVSTTAETPPVDAERLARGRVEVTAVASQELNDEGEGAPFVVNGPLDIYGIFGVMTTAADETEELSLITESGTTLMALGEVHTATAAGDVFFAATVGAAPTVDEVGVAEQHLFTDPIRITGTEDSIDLLAEGDVDGGGECTLYCVWAPVISSAEVATS